MFVVANGLRHLAVHLGKEFVKDVIKEKVKETLAHQARKIAAEAIKEYTAKAHSDAAAIAKTLPKGPPVVSNGAFFGLRNRDIDALRRDIRSLAKEFPDEIKKINYEIANEVIVPEAQRRAGGVIGKTATGRALRPGKAVVADIRAYKQLRAGVVAIGSAKVPWAAGMEFGSVGVKKTPRGGHTTQFAPWRGNGKGGGYMVYAAIRERQGEIISRYMEAVDALLRDKGM